MLVGQVSAQDPRIQGKQEKEHSAPSIKAARGALPAVGSVGIGAIGGAFGALSEGYNQANAVRRVMGFVRALTKARYTRPFAAIGSHLHHFMEKYPVVGKILVISQIFCLIGVVTELPRLGKQLKKVVYCRGGKQFNASMKVLTVLGKMTRCFGYAILGFEAFQLGKKLGELSLPVAETAFSALSGAVGYIFAAGFILAAAQVVVDGRSLWKTHQFLKQLNKQEWIKAKTDADYQQFKNYLLNMTPKEQKVMGSRLQVNGATLRKSLLSQMQNTTATERDLQEMERHLKLIKGKLRTSQGTHVVSMLTGLVGLAGTICMLIPPAHPAALVCLSAQSAGLLGKMVFNNIKRYQFENQMGMIERQTATPRTWKATLIDYSKWQVGWYDSHSILHRLGNIGGSIGTAVVEVAAVLNDAVEAFIAMERVLT